MEHVQAFILNTTIPKSLDELRDYSFEGSSGPIEMLMHYAFDGDKVLDGWTAPRWASIGDVAFFMQAKSTGQWIARLRKELYDLCDMNFTYDGFVHFIDYFGNVYVSGKEPEDFAVYGPDPTPEYWGHPAYAPEDDIDLDELLIEFNPGGEITHIDGGLNWIFREDYPYATTVEYPKLKQAVMRNVDENDFFYISCNYPGAFYILLALYKVQALFNAYGDGIFALGRVCTTPKHIDHFDDGLHWASPIYADYDHLVLLKQPIHLAEFKEFISFRQQGSVTPVLGDAYEKLLSLVLESNDIDEYYQNTVAAPLTLSKMTESNWLETTREYRRKFLLEAQFREYFVNRFLKHIADNKQLFSECLCHRGTRSIKKIDNVILFDGLYLPVEVKLNVNIEKDICKQCRSYCHVPQIELRQGFFAKMDQVWQQVLVIDCNNVYLYNFDGNRLNTIISLDSLTSNKDIKVFSTSLSNILKSTI